VKVFHPLRPAKFALHLPHRSVAEAVPASVIVGAEAATVLAAEVVAGAGVEVDALIVTAVEAIATVVTEPAPEAVMDQAMAQATEQAEVEGAIFRLRSMPRLRRRLLPTTHSPLSRFRPITRP
jgi:hypothetical protein